MSDRLRIVVCGYMVRAPLGGQIWHYLQYLTGLKAMGHDVLYIEDSCFFEDDEYEWYYKPDSGKNDADPSYGLQFVGDLLKQVGLQEQWAFYEASAARWHGLTEDAVMELCRDADLFLNVSGVNPVRPWLADIPRRVFVDTDPAFTQIRILTNPINRRHALQHNVFATFGENIPVGGSGLPRDSFHWFATRQPVALEMWPVTPGRRDASLTAVLAWQTYAPVEHEGRKYGVKADSFGPFLDLPTRSRETFELALSGDQAPRDLLRSNGWNLLDRGPRTPSDYQSYLQASKAEFGIAKHGYVVSHCGWFSERSAAYLASGRPVVVQDAGFSKWLPCGLGVLPFGTPEEALAALDDLSANYEKHCRAARELVAEYFDAPRVLERLIEQATARPVVARLEAS